MARPNKEGMDYFSHDTDACSDEKIEVLRTLYGNDGYAFYFIMLERIYRTNDFQIDVSEAETREETFQILSKKILVTQEKFMQMLNTALKWGCFDKELYEKRSVITSSGIKKRSSAVVNKRKLMKEKYEKSRLQGVSEAETREETVSETPQSKVKESKVKESKVKNIDIPYEDIFSLYVQQGIIRHKSFTEEMKKAIAKAVKSHTLEEIFTAIKRYGIMYRDKTNPYAREFCKYTWTLTEFMTREKGIADFLDEGGKWYRYSHPEPVKGKKQDNFNNFEQREYDQAVVEELEKKSHEGLEDVGNINLAEELEKTRNN